MIGMISPNGHFGGAPHKDELKFAAKVDTSNTFAVGVTVKGVVLVNRPLGGALSKAEALNLAAWIVALTAPAPDEFERLLEAIRNT